MEINHENQLQVGAEVKIELTGRIVEIGLDEMARCLFAKVRYGQNWETMLTLNEGGVDVQYLSSAQGEPKPGELWETRVGTQPLRWLVYAYKEKDSWRTEGEIMLTCGSTSLPVGEVLHQYGPLWRVLATAQ